MESAIAVYKLIILYMLDRAAGKDGNAAAGDGEISMPQISVFLIENAYVNFESLVDLYSEIKRDGFVTERTLGGKTFLAITSEGRETVRMFKSQLSDDIRNKIDDFLKNNGRTLREEHDVTGEYYKASYGGYNAHLMVRENKKVIFEVSINLPDEETAKAAAEKFRGGSAGVYETVIAEIFRE